MSQSIDDIQLRTFELHDIDKLISWIDGPGSADLWASRTYTYPLTHERVQLHLKKTSTSPSELKIFKIIAGTDNKVVGHVELDKFDHLAKSVRITRLFIASEHRRMGYAFKAIRQLLKYCFYELNFNRVEILAIETNQPALQLYLRLGFEREGFLRENMFLGGQHYGSHLLSILKRDFERVNQQMRI